ncbi:MAG: 50S ribosomal protein L35 [Deltaproteobacteria bacterium]
MPKQKTHSGAKKRFKLTGTGLIKHFHSSASHLMRKKSKKAKRNLRTVDILDKSNVARVKALLGI